MNTIREAQHGAIISFIVMGCTQIFPLGIAWWILRNDLCIWLKALAFPGFLAFVIAILSGCIHGSVITKNKLEPVGISVNITQKKRLREAILTFGLIVVCAWGYVLIMYLGTSAITGLLRWVKIFLLMGLFFTIYSASLGMWLTITLYSN